MADHRLSSTLLIVSIIAILAALALGQGETPQESQSIRVRLDDGSIAEFVQSAQGNGEYVRADDAANSTSPSGVRWGVLGWLFFFGLAGQAMFMGRFALQWIVSERSGKSVVPLGFWWLSLAGATILLTYFVIRQDPIGVLGQSLGWPIYLRNIYMVLRDRRAGTISATDPAEHPIGDPNAEA